MPIFQKRREVQSRPAEYVDAEAYVTAEGGGKANPQTYVVGGGSAPSYFGEKSRDKARLEKYERIYEQEGTVGEAIDNIALFTAMPGFEILSNDKQAEAVVRAFFERTDKFNLIISIVTDDCIYGDCFMENVFTVGGDFVKLLPVNPKTIEKAYDDYGTALYYTQAVTATMGKTLKKVLDKKFITQFTLKRIGRNPYGVSIIGRNYDTIHRMVKTDEGIAEAIRRHGFPKYHIPVGKPGETIPKETLGEVSKEFENINANNEFVTGPDVKIMNIDAGASMQVKDFTEIYATKLKEGMGAPLGMQGSAKSPTDQPLWHVPKAFEFKIRALQCRIADIFETEVFPLILASHLAEKNPQLKALMDEESNLRELDAVDDTEEDGTRKLSTGELEQKGELRKLREKILKELSLAMQQTRVQMVFNELNPEDLLAKAQWLKLMMPDIDPFIILSKEEVRGELGFTTHPENTPEETASDAENPPQ